MAGTGTDGSVVAAFAGKERTITDGRIVAAGYVVIKRIKTVGRVEVPGFVEHQGLKSVGGVARAGGVVIQRERANGRIVAAVVGNECTITDSRVLAAGGIEAEGIKTHPGVAIADCIARERISANGRIPDTVCEAKESVLPLGRVIARIGSVRCRDNALRGLRKRKPCERERDEKKTAPQRRPAH